MKEPIIRARARRQPGTKWKQLAIPEELHARIDKLAAQAGRSTAHEIRLALEDWLRRTSPPPPPS